ncbi:hypothetical protein V8F33_006946 [Rhypophila sp. PSN 637]
MYSLRYKVDQRGSAYSQYTKGDLAMAAVATRDIEPAEEISISYIPLGMPTLYRRKSLSNWSFKCTCSLCSSGTDSPSESDKRRNRLIGLFHHMKKLHLTTNPTWKLSRNTTN